MIDLLFGDDERRLEADHVAVNSAHADQDALAKQRVADGFSFGVRGREFFVAHQLYADHQAKPADFADQRILLLDLAQFFMAYSPVSAARAGRFSSSITWMLASDAAQATGFPPKVERWSPGL